MEKQNCKKLNHKHKNQSPGIRERFIQSMVCMGLCEIKKIPPHTDHTGKKSPLMEYTK